VRPGNKPKSGRPDRRLHRAARATFDSGGAGRCMVSVGGRIRRRRRTECFDQIRPLKVQRSARGQIVRNISLLEDLRDEPSHRNDTRDNGRRGWQNRLICIAGVLIGGWRVLGYRDTHTNDLPARGTVKPCWKWQPGTTRQDLLLDSGSTGHDRRLKARGCIGGAGRRGKRVQEAPTVSIRFAALALSTMPPARPTPSTHIHPS
jgi:hypothetical protein